MAKEDQKVDPKAEFLLRLFGKVDELEGEELDMFLMLLEAHAHEVDATERVRMIAQAAAAELRARKEKIPAHLESALRATRNEPFASSSIAVLRKIVESLNQPILASVNDPVFAHRNLKEDEVTDNDRKILDGLAEELQQDWQNIDDEES